MSSEQIRPIQLSNRPCIKERFCLVRWCCLKQVWKGCHVGRQHCHAPLEIERDHFHSYQIVLLINHKYIRSGTTALVPPQQRPAAMQLSIEVFIEWRHVSSSRKENVRSPSLTYCHLRQLLSISISQTSFFSVIGVIIWKNRLETFQRSETI